MSNILVVGSVAFDSVETPFGKAEEVLGGSGTYFSVAASYFSKVSLVAVVGEDFPDEHVKVLEDKGIDLEGLTKVPERPFAGRGATSTTLTRPTRLRPTLNVFSDFDPVIPDSYKKAPYVFLANIDPELQLKGLRAGREPEDGRLRHDELLDRE